MTYLFGDSSAFPLNENFIETVRQTTQICCELLESDASIEAIHQRMGVEVRRTEEARGDLQRIREDLEMALRPFEVATSSSETCKLAARVLRRSRAELEAADKELAEALTGRLDELRSELQAVQARVPSVLAQFLLHHELGATAWRVHWEAGSAEAAATAHARALSSTGLEASFELQLSEEERWCRPLRVAELSPEVVVSVARRGGWLRRSPKQHALELDNYLVTKVDLTPARTTVVLRRGPKPSAPGLQITFDDLPGPRVVVRELVGQHRPGEPIEVDASEHGGLLALQQAIEEQVAPLVNERVRLTGAEFNGLPVDQSESPATLAMLLIKAVAPLVREVRRRSHTPDELVLKRLVNDGHRDELFLPVSVLRQLLAGLSPEHQGLFGEYGLDEPVHDRDAPIHDGLGAPSVDDVDAETVDAAPTAVEENVVTVEAIPAGPGEAPLELVVGEVGEQTFEQLEESV